MIKTLKSQYKTGCKTSPVPSTILFLKNGKKNVTRSGIRTRDHHVNQISSDSPLPPYIFFIGRNPDCLVESAESMMLFNIPLNEPLEGEEGRTPTV